MSHYVYLHIYLISLLFVQQIIKEYWGSSIVKVEHLTTFYFRDNNRLEAYIAEDSTSVVALSGPGQVCVILNRI